MVFNNDKIIGRYENGKSIKSWKCDPQKIYYYVSYTNGDIENFYECTEDIFDDPVYALEYARAKSLEYIGVMVVRNGRIMREYENKQIIFNDERILPDGEPFRERIR